MNVVMGALNKVRLFDIMNGTTGHCSRVTAAVAYATGNNPFIDHCLTVKIATLRATLLPRLISGQLRLPEAQTTFAVEATV